MAEDVCPKCGGSSWVVTERDGIAGAEQCECFLQTRARLIRERAGIPKLYHKASFETFRIPDDNPVTRNILATAHRTAKSYADNLKKHPKPGLLFVGDPGTGKTHLAIATLKRILTNGFEGRFFDFQTLLEQIQRGWNPSAGTADREAYKTALDIEVLLLDDLGARRSMDWIEDVVAAIITHRCNNTKHTIVTTNHPMPDVNPGQGLRKTLPEMIGQRAYSRLFEMCTIVKMSGVEDFRKGNDRVRDAFRTST
jgi:DNA replication protein DnaC